MARKRIYFKLPIPEGSPLRPGDTWVDAHGTQWEVVKVHPLLQKITARKIA